MFRRRALCLVVLMVCMIAGVSSRPRAQDGQPRRTTLDLAGLGVNVPDQIINPDQDDRGLAGMQEQASRLLHDAHMMGAKTVRWFVTAVWSQYPCSRDPEDQATGALYPAWYKITRALLEAAEVEHIAVVIVMADTSNGKFIDHTHDQESRDRLLAGWSKYQSPSGCAVSFQNGYYGASAPPRFFEDPTIVHHLGARFVAMAKYLVGFPSLGGLEMFNEPEFDEVHRVQFATTVRALRERIRHEVPATATLPIYSGVASWDTKIAASLRQAGDLVDEPYITQHWYGDYSGQSAERLQANIDWIRTFIPDRRLIIAEAGSSVTIKNPAVHATMVSSLMSTMKNAHVGVWPWGTYFDPSSTAPDYKWEFNTRGLGGEAFRGFLIDTSREAAFARATQVSFEHGAEPFRIQQVGPDAPEAGTRLRWRISIGSDSFLSVTRDGVLRRRAPGYESLLNTPGATIAIGESTVRRQWLAVETKSSGWALQVYDCDTLSQPGIRAEPTPLYVLDYARISGRTDFSSCGKSGRVKTAMLGG